MSQEQAEFDYSSLRLAPLQYTFGGSEMYGVEESATVQQHMYADPAPHSDAYFPEQTTVSSQTDGEESVGEVEDEDEAATPSQGSECDSGCDCSSLITETDLVAASSVLEHASDDEGAASSSCSSEEEDEGDYSEGRGNDASCSANCQRRRRKRKMSAQRLLSPCSAKKCCVEERQLTGLISVFNSGLTVVADQFLARPAASTVSSLQQTPKPISSFMHIACNPLIC